MDCDSTKITKEADVVDPDALSHDYTSDTEPIPKIFFEGGRELTDIIERVVRRMDRTTAVLTAPEPMPPAAFTCMSCNTHFEDESPIECSCGNNICRACEVVWGHGAIDVHDAGNPLVEIDRLWEVDVANEKLLIEIQLKDLEIERLVAENERMHDATPAEPPPVEEEDR